MKIAVFSDTYFPQINGVSRSVYNSARILTKFGHKISIFTHEKAELSKDFEVIRFKIIKFFKHDDYDLILPNSIKLSKYLKKINPDIIHIHTPTLLGFLALQYGKKNNIPVVITYHTYLPEFLDYLPITFLNKTNFMKKFTWNLTIWFYNKCDYVLAPSKVIIDELLKNGLKRKYGVVSNGVDLNEFYVEKVPKKYECDFLHVGRIGYEKSVDIVLKAFSLLDKKAKLFVVGGGPQIEELKKLSKELKIDKRVNFLGPKRGKELLNYYNGCKVFVTASTIETEGIVLLEAMACGKPIIGVNKLAVPQVVKNKYNGYIVNQGNYKEFSKCMELLYKNKKLREKFGKNSLKRIKEYSLEKCVKKLEKIYKKIKI